MINSIKEKRSKMQQSSCHSRDPHGTDRGRHMAFEMLFFLLWHELEKLDTGVGR
jgi:hypothetical protein